MSEQYRKFYSEYKNKLFSYLMYKSGDYEVARDIMQESFTRHFQHYGKEAVMLSPALLFTIARNALSDHRRSQKRYLLVEEVQPQIDQLKGDEERTYLAKKESERVHQALDKLPSQDREILSLAVSGVAYKEIAAIFELSEGNVKVRIHRTRIKLREMLQNEVK
jgi:RNA polymerase sigma-70 factor, ECF subfamily